MKTNNPQILIIENEAIITGTLSIPFKMAELDIISATDLADANAKIATTKPKLVLLDSTSLHKDVAAYVHHLRSHHRTSHLPLILLTKSGEETLKIAELDGAIDEYVTIPFSPLDLIARIQHLLKVGSTFNNKDLVNIDNDLHLHLPTRNASIHGHNIELSPMLFDLLYFFTQHPGEIYSREQLAKKAWTTKKELSAPAVDTHVRKLRKILKPYNYDHLIQTVHRVGYRFGL